MKKRITERMPVERIDDDVSLGLNSEQVKERIEKGYINKSSKTHEKTIGMIIFHNVFTFFNTILLIIAIMFFIFI